jgi:hypothetical protein
MLVSNLKADYKWTIAHKESVLAFRNLLEGFDKYDMIPEDKKAIALSRFRELLHERNRLLLTSIQYHERKIAFRTYYLLGISCVGILSVLLIKSPDTKESV